MGSGSGWCEWGGREGVSERIERVRQAMRDGWRDGGMEGPRDGETERAYGNAHGRQSVDGYGSACRREQFLWDCVDV